MVYLGPINPCYKQETYLDVQSLKKTALQGRDSNNIYAVAIVNEDTEDGISKKKIKIIKITNITFYWFYLL